MSKVDLPANVRPSVWEVRSCEDEDPDDEDELLALMLVASVALLVVWSAVGFARWLHRRSQ